MSHWDKVICRFFLKIAHPKKECNVQTRLEWRQDLATATTKCTHNIAIQYLSNWESKRVDIQAAWSGLTRDFTVHIIYPVVSFVSGEFTNISRMLMYCVDTCSMSPLALRTPKHIIYLMYLNVVNPKKSDPWRYQKGVDMNHLLSLPCQT